MINEKERHYAYNVTQIRVRANFDAVEKNKYYIFRVCNCILRYPPCNAHAPYFHLWPARFYSVFPHYLIKGAIFEKKNFEYKMCVLIFSTTFV